MSRFWNDLIQGADAPVREALHQAEASHRPALEALAAASPLYAQALLQDPGVAAWLLDPAIVRPVFGPGRLARLWTEFQGDTAGDDDCLRRFRRQMSLRIAFREVNSLAPVADTLLELSHLADFCLRQVFAQCLSRAETRLGSPRDDEGQPLQLCVLGFGKLGGQELNFCSDVDLLYLTSGVGHVYRNGIRTALDSQSFFTRVCQEATAILQKRTAAGFLYNVDLRLRPEGDSGQLVWPVNAAVNYYFTRGQTWERLALLKVRAVAGEADVAGEFLELVHTFRYPRHPPASLPEDVALMKRRTEQQIVGNARMSLNVKSGYGGIREIEFFAQVLQLVHAARYPFLQTGSTREALRQLERYELLTPDNRQFLENAYDWLRLVENRLQMREEMQVHTLPEDPEARAVVASSLGYPNREHFDTRLGDLRRRVREFYDQLFPQHSGDETAQPWMAFFTGAEPSPEVAALLQRWFGSEAQAHEQLRDLILGDRRHHITREEVGLFLDIASQFDTVFPKLFSPLGTLQRLQTFAGRYGARSQFLKVCRDNPSLLEMLCLVFDRSTFIYKLLLQHPEILEELLAGSLRQRKEVPELEREIALGPSGEAFAPWLWLYVKAEQVRVSLNELLGFFDLIETERQLTALAEAVVRATLRHLHLEEALGVIGLGKFGAQEMSLGSDLDLILLAATADDGELLARVRSFLNVLGYSTPLGKTFELDLRLRPHGQDGPLLVTLTGLERYHTGSAQPWEKQILLRARHVAGSAALGEGFSRWRETLLFSTPPSPEEEQALDAMREKAYQEKVKHGRPELFFKVGRGGLVDIEYFVQRLQLREGRGHPTIRGTNTRRTLVALGQAGLLPPATVQNLLRHYNFLRRLELYLRREAHDGVAELQEADLPRIAKWLGLPSPEAFWEEYTHRLAHTHELVQNPQRPG